MAISHGDSVTLNYVGRLADGEVFDTSDRALAEQEGLLSENPGRMYEPLTLDVGDGSVLPGLQEALLGMEAGQQATVTIPPEQAYGYHTEERIGEYDREAFESMIGDHELTAGFEVEADSGLEGRVVDIGEETVTVDFNHELAGETLTFEIEIIDVE
ncbi:MAG: FKBP-type peptidyl-prolyl cis-trans isomerases 2 [halophilic archaeon J07HX64]|jgi:FKBP-type peptidyl-prolyl cis-trans isomerases 2|nr:MAG: FKBP-type peptidyl-prolyl cis-trans isomerases 2 [halophilic archaeon J07HX64]